MSALVRECLDAWGTTITVDVATDTPASARERLTLLRPRMRALVDAVDRTFSTWRDDSLAIAHRRGWMDEDDIAACGPEGRDFIDVLSRTRELTRITGGAFDPCAAPGGFDPSGYVKGWGAGRIADLVVDAGLPDVCVNAAGDVAVRGHGPRGPWRAGILHPHASRRLLGEVPLHFAADIGGPVGAIATSGWSEQFGHVLDPRTGRAPTAGTVQASVIGPDAGVADALATALLVDGHAGFDWFEAFAASDAVPGRLHSRWSAVVVEDRRVWTCGVLARSLTDSASAAA